MERSSDEVRAFVAARVDELGLVLVDVEYKGSPKRLFLRVLIHKQGGVTAGDCNRVAVRLQKSFDEADYFFPGKYRLEVASPGLDRPLRIYSDFARNLGRKVRLFLREPHEGRTELVGRIDRVGEEDLTLLPEDGQRSLQLSLRQIHRGKLVVEF